MTKDHRGGARQGAGRKSQWQNKGEKTILHVPIAIAPQLRTIAHALDEGKAVQLTDESEKLKKLREAIKREYEQMEIAAQERGLKPHQMPTWKNVNRLLEQLEKILNN